MSKTTARGERYPKMFFDIETRENPAATALLDDPVPPGNYKDPEKIAAYVEEARAKAVEMSPLDGDLCQIAAIGYAIGRDGEIVANVVTKKNPERKVLVDFWTQFAIVNGSCAGYNILAFDLPVILKRSFDLGIKPSLIPSLIKYRTEPVTDLQMLLCSWDYRSAHKFKWICKRYGIELPAGYEVNGAQVKDMTEKEIRTYVHSDVYGVRELYYKMQGYYFV